MDVSTARELLENDVYENEKWDHGCPLTIGLEILNKYRDGTRYDFRFEHDQLYIADFEDTVKKMTHEDFVTMIKNGWFESEESWSLFS